MTARAMTAISLCALAILALAPQAGAGSYEVAACGGAAGSEHGAFVASAQPGMAAYTICPATPSNPASGLVTRASATSGPGSVPYFAGAYQVFEAPPGASLASVTFDVAAVRLAGYWTTGVVAYDGDFNRGDLPWGCYAGSAGCAIGTASFFGPVTAGLGGHSRFRFESRCANPAGCDISGSGFQPGMRALFSTANVRVVVQDFTRPAIAPTAGALWRDGWHHGHEEAWQSVTDNVGIMALRLWVDGQLEENHDFRVAGGPAERCAFTRRRPCQDLPSGGLSVDTRTLSDGRHKIRVEAVDAAGNATSTERSIEVDNTAPAHVVTSVEHGEGWRQSNDFAVRWSNPVAAGSPVMRAHYRLCPLAGGTQRCTTAVREADAIERLAGLSLPSQGEYALSVWLEDAAGNTDPANASDRVALRFDGSPPQAAFDLLDESDPTLIEARVSDSASGVAAGTIEIRRAGWRQWHELETALANDRLVARLDDAALADGAYELRARVRDRAGNEGFGDRRIDGTRMELALPLRTASRLELSAVRGKRRCGKRKRARCRTGGRGVSPLAGSLVTSAGEPIAGAAITVHEQLRTGRDMRRVATLRTDRDGRFRHVRTGGPSRTLRFRYAGTTLVRPAAAELRLRVPARTSIAIDRRRLRNGQSVRFAGRLLGGHVPRDGKLIDLQAHFRGRWRTFATPRSDSRGRWRYRYRFGATSGLVRYRFRARVRRESAYPFELGHSRVVSVVVRGP